MALFKINEKKIKKLIGKEPKSEKILQELFEANLEEILNITFLSSEYSTSFGGRIKHLADALLKLLSNKHLKNKYGLPIFVSHLFK